MKRFRAVLVLVAVVGCAPKADLSIQKWFDMPPNDVHAAFDLRMLPLISMLACAEVSAPEQVYACLPSDGPPREADVPALPDGTCWVEWQEGVDRPVLRLSERSGDHLRNQLKNGDAQLQRQSEFVPGLKNRTMGLERRLREINADYDGGTRAQLLCQEEGRESPARYRTLFGRQIGGGLKLLYICPATPDGICSASPFEI